MSGNLVLTLDVPDGGEPSHVHDFDRSEYGGGVCDAEFDRWTWNFSDGDLTVYVGAHPERRIGGGPPPDDIAVDGHAGLSFVLRNHLGLQRELLFLPACWLTVFCLARSEHLAQAFEMMLGELRLELRGAEILCRTPRPGLVPGTEQSPRPAREIVCEPVLQALGPIAISNQPALVFPDTPVGSRSAMAFTLVTTGRFAYGVIDLPEGFRLYDRFGAQFLEETIDMPLELNGSSEVLTIAFAPTKPGPHEGRVRFRHRSHPVSLSVSGNAVSSPAILYRDNETLVESSELPLGPDLDGVRMLVSCNELNFGVVKDGDEVSRPLYLRSDHDEPIPIHLSGVDIVDGTQLFSVALANGDPARLDREGMLWLQPDEQLSLLVRCRCQKSRLLWPRAELVVATPTRTYGISLKFEVPGTSVSQGWGFYYYSYYDSDSDRRSLVERFDPQIQKLIEARTPPPPPVG